MFAMILKYDAVCVCAGTVNEIVPGGAVCGIVFVDTEDDTAELATIAQP